MCEQRGLFHTDVADLSSLGGMCSGDTLASISVSLACMENGNSFRRIPKDSP